VNETPRVLAGGLGNILKTILISSGSIPQTCSLRNFAVATLAFLGSATVPVALAGVSPASFSRIRLWLMSESRLAERVFGETPKTAVERPEQHKNCPLCGLPALPRNIPSGFVPLMLAMLVALMVFGQGSLVMVVGNFGGLGGSSGHSPCH